MTQPTLFLSHMFSENNVAAVLFSNHLSYVASPQQQKDQFCPTVLSLK